MVAEFSDPARLIEAAEKTRDAGFKKFDCHSPFPIHGMDQAMGMKRSRLGWAIGIMGFIGAIGGTWMQWWMNAVDYPTIISGKPFFSFQTYVPITFGMGVLFGALTAVLGMFHVNRMPQLFHPLFYSDEFSRVTNDGFFVSVDASDPQFEPEKTKAFFDSIGATRVDVLEGE